MTLGMEPASTFQELVNDVNLRLTNSRYDEALVSIVFANPSSVVFEDLRANYAYLDLRSGRHWDLYFAGYRDRSWGRFHDAKGPRHPTDYFDHRNFLHLVDEVSAHHGRELTTSTQTPQPMTRWRYSGGCDLVSLMVYGTRGFPHWDWLSLRAVRLTDANGAYVEYGLPEIVEVASRWREEPDGLSHFGAGEFYVTTDVQWLGPALTAAGNAVATGIAGNLAYDFLRSVT